MRGMDAAAYETLHRGRKTIEEISTQTGISKSSLYRYGLPVESSGLDIPLRKLVPIMKAAGNYSILKILNTSCGFLPVRVPRAARCKLDDEKMVSRYQRTCNDAVNRLLQFLEKPTVNTHNALNIALDDVASQSMGIKKRAATWQQTELALD